MSKRKPTTKTTKTNHQQPTPFMIFAGIGVALVVILGVLALPTLFPSTDAASGAAVAANVVGEADAPQPTIQRIRPDDYQAFSDEHVLIDVRTPGEYASGHIEGSINIPVEELGWRLDEVPTGTPIVVYCRSGNRSAQAASILRSAGDYASIYDLGGIIAWTNAGYPVAR